MRRDGARSAAAGSLVRPKIVRSVHYAPKTGRITNRDYRDSTSMGGMPTGTAYPKEDEDGNPLETEFGLSTYIDHQSIGLQEMPEVAPPGQLPRGTDAFLDHDLGDRVKPGDRVQIVGVYCPLPSRSQGQTSGVFRTVVLANHVRLLAADVQAPSLSDSDVKRIRQLARGKESVFDVLARSLAPSIYGHDVVKKGLLCLLLGGVEKTLDNSMHLRGYAADLCAAAGRGRARLIAARAVPTPVTSTCCSSVTRRRPNRSCCASC